MHFPSFVLHQSLSQGASSLHFQRSCRISNYGLSPPNWIQMFVCVAQHVSVQCVVGAINKFASKNEIKDGGGGFPGWEREILSLCVSLSLSAASPPYLLGYYRLCKSIDRQTFLVMAPTEIRRSPSPPFPLYKQERHRDFGGKGRRRERKKN